jgi:putative intracellular protease/amidase
MQKKVLCVVSSADSIFLQNGKRVETGFFLIETIVPIQLLRRGGYEVVYANPAGNKPSMDSMSDSRFWFGFRSGEYADAKRQLDFEWQAGLAQPRPLNTFSDMELEGFAGIFIPGGHAPIADLSENADLGRILRHFHNRSKPTATLCHGPVALLSSANLPEGVQWPYLGYRLTCYSNVEERMNELLWRSKVPLKVADELAAKGAIVNNSWPMLPHLQFDRELITGQGPFSAYGLGEAFVHALDRYFAVRAVFMQQM